MSHLFEPLTIRSITLRNRIGVAPMCQYSYTDGCSNDWQLAHLGARAAGGVGLVISEATAVEERGRITPHDVGIWDEAHIAPLRRVTNFIKAQGAIPGIQIAHAGRKADTQRPWDGGKPLTAGHPDFWPVVGPSPLPFAEGYQTPQALSLAEIQLVQQAFKAGAQRAAAAGFEWLEIHAAHGYLIHNFLSPLSNQRTDAYGGTFENRIRFLLETIRQIQQVWPEHLPITVRLSATEWIEGGWTPAESVALARQLITAGIDLVDCSSGGNIPKAQMPLGPGYQVPLSEAVRATGMRTAAVGLITAPEQADEIIRNGRADLVLLGREMLRDPHWAIRAARALNQPAPVPNPYLRAY